jgi:thiol-disulfide isomerase/thioredoxin
MTFIEVKNLMSKETRTNIFRERRAKKWRLVLYIAILIAIALGIFVYVKYLPPPNGKYNSFAQCINASGATFYGAFWCPHCQNEKKLFGNAAQFLPYVECSTPDASGQLQVCKDASVQSYPTWVFKDGSRLTGEVPLNQLAQKTGCPLPTSTQ